MEAVESEGQHGDTDRRTSKRDRRNLWACVFLLVNNCLQYTAYFGVSTNLLNYIKDRLHEGSKAAANNVTNWQGTGSITPLFAAFLADAFLGRYWTITLFLLISVVVRTYTNTSASTPARTNARAVLYMLEICYRPFDALEEEPAIAGSSVKTAHGQRRSGKSKSVTVVKIRRRGRRWSFPPLTARPSLDRSRVFRWGVAAQANLGYGVVTASASAALQSTVFYAGLYLVALGGALQPVMSSFGADQFDESDEEERGRQSSFFNWFYLSINVGSLVGGTVLVWVQSSVGWGLGYGIPALFSVLAVALFLAGTGAYRRHQPPGGSPLTRIAQVVVAAVRKYDVQTPSDAAMLYECEADDGMSAIQGSRRFAHTDQFRFLDKAAVETNGDKARPSPWRLCTVTQVEELKCVLRLLPVWASGIIFAAAYTQMTTTFILQGDTLDPRVGRFSVPAAVLSVFDTLSVMLWVPLYDRVIVPLARRQTGHERGFTQLARMGVGLVILTVAMLAAGTLEVARRQVIARHGMYDSNTGGDRGYLPLSIFWQVPQYVVVGAAEVFTFIGQLEFFYDQAPDAMRSLCSGLSNASFALGSYTSSVLVAVVARATARGGRPGWIPDDFNRAHLDYFFWLLAMLCIGNFGVYLLIARWYTYKKTGD